MKVKKIKILVIVILEILVYKCLAMVREEQLLPSPPYLLNGGEINFYLAGKHSEIEGGPEDVPDGRYFSAVVDILTKNPLNYVYNYGGGWTVDIDATSAHLRGGQEVFLLY